MYEVPKLLQVSIKEVVESMITIKEEVRDIVKAYWSTDANTLVSALENASDAATLSTKLTKSNYINAVTIVSELNDFFSNADVTQADHIQNCHLIKYSSAVTPTKLSESTEMIGERMLQVVLDCLEIFKKCNNILKIYTSEQMDVVVSGWDAQRMIPSSSMSTSCLSSGIVLIEQFKKMFNNEVVTTADYASTLALWARF